METKSCTCWEEHWETHGGAESLHHTPGTNTTLYVNYAELKLILIFKKERKEGKRGGCGTACEYIVGFGLYPVGNVESQQAFKQEFIFFFF